MRTLIHLGWALHLTETPVPAVHRHHALQVTVSLGSVLRLLDGGRGSPRSAAGWVVGPDVPHGIDGEGPYAVFLLEPAPPFASGWMERLRGKGLLPLQEEEARELARQAFACWRGEQWVLPAAEALIARFDSGKHFGMGGDPRVQRIIERLQKAPDENRSLGALAEEVQLSESRLSHLFRAQVGLPLRSYRLWLRMRRAALHLAAGHDATEAAHLAGFSDSAHLSRTCLRMFGLSPSRLPRMSVPSAPG